MSIKDILAKARKYTDSEYIPDGEPTPEPVPEKNPFNYHVKWVIPDDTDLQRAIMEACDYMGFPVEIESANSSPLYFTYTLFYDGDPEKLVRKQNRLSGLVNQSCELEISGNGRICCKVKNPGNNIIRFGDVWRNGDFSGSLPMAIGYDTYGNPVVKDLAELPHLLVAGQTKGGKSVLLHGIICSLLLESDADLILVDPKTVEFSYYKSLRRVKLITESGRAIQILDQLCQEMDSRYRRIARAGFRDIDSYNEQGGRMKRKVLIVDELADLMNKTGKDRKQIEESLQRIGQKARACGIHMILCTQSPRKDVLSGAIKSNIPAKCCLRTSNRIESQIVIDSPGAEKLAGHGHMIWKFGIETFQCQSGMITEQDIQNAVCIASGRW